MFRVQEVYLISIREKWTFYIGSTVLCRNVNTSEDMGCPGRAGVTMSDSGQSNVIM